jgi:hypothetical protein
MEELIPTINTILVFIAIMVVPTFVGIAYMLMRPWIASKVGFDNLQKAEMAAMLVVRSMDQIGTRMGMDGADKKNMAFSTLRTILDDLSVPINEDLYDEWLDLLIESKVQEIRAEAKPKVEVAVGT